MCSNTNTPRRSKRKPKPRNFSLNQYSRKPRKPNPRNFSMKQYSRKTRTKTRKPKYLSLDHLEENSPQTQMSLIDDDDDKEITDTQLNLFPLHPENLVEDRDTQYDNVSFLFNTTAEDNDHAVTLNGLLDSEVSDNCKNETATTMTSEESHLSPSLSTYGYYSTCEDHRTRLSLVRTAMKGKKERDASEEKWVVYSEVVEKREMEEVSSDGGAWCNSSSTSSSKKKMEKLLALKLDYEEIMNAWSDKCPLYVEGESPQTVPHLHEPDVLVDGLGSASNVWKVPELDSNLKMKEEIDGKEEVIKREHREASLLRYKEKRQNRLFSKRIRYEVRKLNAEKRPRLKGRFVKRD